MTKREEDRLNALLAKKEKEEKDNKEFFSMVRKRKEEVLKHLVKHFGDTEIRKILGIDNSWTEDRMDNIAEKYGLDRWELMDYFDTDQQVKYFKRTHKEKNS